MAAAGADTVDAVARALWRSAVYRFFSQALLPPDRWREPPVPPGPRPAGTAAGGEDAGAPASTTDGPATAVAAAARTLTAADPPALAAAYVETFGHLVGPRCPLYEAQYIPGGIFAQAQCASDIAGFYRAFGLEVADHAQERPDHISVELEFMHVLAYREAYARTHHGCAQVAQLVDAQRQFLQDHLGRWVPALARVTQTEAPGLYAQVLDALTAWITADAAAQGATVEPEAALAPRADLPGLEDDRAGCGPARCPLGVVP
ncbi:MAG: molecular chaperone TorD family protein [Armatimonadota bacterium]|nr:molecular chaperone TorD family protein [Armatimonadota bacterium]MDR7486308.1 molecular chaperone TorD family protein [Armatimonadota bacterium]MDR7532283.1 molecular chaperone TorD family protein [Armatimonadota bacterium]MDR7537244.1 molecular chaperone TorD family protein [Armatimonadota bacterium]